MRVAHVDRALKESSFLWTSVIEENIAVLDRDDAIIHTLGKGKNGKSQLCVSAKLTIQSHGNTHV